MNRQHRPGRILAVLAGVMLLLCACRQSKSTETTAIRSAGEDTVIKSSSIDLRESEQTDSEQADPEQTDQEQIEPLEAQTDSTELEEDEANMANIYVTVNNTVLTAKLASNSSAEALIKKLQGGDITIDMHDYASFEKVGSLGFRLPRNDRNYTTKAGDIILYQGDQLVFYYDTNSWSFTKLGEFQDIDLQGLKDIFGEGGITVTLSLKRG